MLQINHILLLLMFASFPYGLPDHRFMLEFVLPAHPQDHEPSISPLSVCPSANQPSFHLPHTETCQWGPHPPFVFTDIYALPGALILHWGTRFCILYIFPKFIHYCVQTPFIPVISSSSLLSSPLATFFPFLATRNPCHPWLEHYFSFTHDGIVYIFSVLPRSLTIYPLNLSTLSRLWHNLSSVLASP
jgi:hypothetical protein